MKKLLIKQFFILIGIILIGWVFYSITFRYFKQLLIQNNQYLVGSMIEKHPELETELIETIGSIDITKKKTFDVLEKYDLDNINDIEELSYVKKVGTILFCFQLLYVIGSFIILSSPYLFYLHREKKEMNKIRNELSKAFHDDFSIQLLDYEEGELSNLKKDLQKVIRMLRDYSEQMYFDKKSLEQTLSDISHQVKTPLTSMYMINELLMNDTLNENKRKEILVKNRKQLERMEWLVSSLLKISRLDSGVITLTKKEVAVKKIIDEALSPLLIPIELKEQTVDVQVEMETIVCDEHWTIEALINLIKNAHEHTKEQGTISIHAFENPIYQIITISDNGDGISKKDLPHIFKRFYKSDEKSDSIGIGLNMAKMIVEKQNGMITVASKEKKGTTFTIKFYKKSSF